MDKYEYKVRADEIKSLIAEGDYAEAVKIADTIDWRRVKSVMMLCTISDLYKINRRYEDSRDILLLAYEKHTGGRAIVYSLCELSIKLEEYVQAIEYYKEFVQLAPKDSGRYVLQYKLYEAQEVSLEERIAVLEEFKKKDYREKWAYELAYLYHRVGLESKCVEECDEMFLWFGDGRYVLKALELKQLHQPLTEEQQQKYEQMKHTGGIIEADIVTEGKAIREEAEKETEDEEDDEFSKAQNVLTDPTQELPGKELDDIQVKTVDVSQYNTINLQRELAESMKEFLNDQPVEQIQEDEEEQKAEEASSSVEEAAPEEKTQSGELPPIRQDTDEMQMISEEMLSERSAEPVKPSESLENTSSEEVFFGNTSEVNINDVVSELVEKDAETAKNIASMQESVSKVAQRHEYTEGKAIHIPAASPSPSVSNTGVIRTFHKPSGYDNILSQEYDGQISLVVPEEEKIEKQITGQLSIDDVMAEWERMKKENEQKMLAEIKQRVHKQTDSLFADFDEATKTGLLEELEKAMVDAAIKESKKKADEQRPKVVKVSDIESQAKDDKPLTEEEPSTEETRVEEILNEVSETEMVPEEVSEETVETEAEQEEIPEKVPEVEPESTEDSDEAAESHSEEKSAEELQEESVNVDEADPSSEAEQKEKTEDKSQAREMTKSEREQFAPFIHHKKTRRQIVEAIDNISMASYTGNVVITGEEGTGTTALAKLLVKEIQLSDNNFSGKVAKISGSNMNKKDVGATLSKLSGGALIIESAATMKRNTVDALVKELNQEGRGLIVLLEDKKDSMEKFLSKHAALNNLFNLRVDVEALDDQTLVKYAKKYALDQEYVIDELGVLALHTRIADMQTSDHEVTLAEIEEIVDEAIYYADKKTPKHFFDILLGKRYDEEDMIILREKDFMHY
ncbi:MAG: hypothetical protein MR992_14475 [Lachnospiraceae bacterium]|nr:hypothetical protein [Lachnospiraceae bacterium]MDD7627297.1 hypothetical protein [Lachnospiraceae bacterium]MDY4119180.1 hypothetical protein [Lachnospiraceae bacterium]